MITQNLDDLGPQKPASVPAPNQPQPKPQLKSQPQPTISRLKNPPPVTAPKKAPSPSRITPTKTTTPAPSTPSVTLQRPEPDRPAANLTKATSAKAASPQPAKEKKLIWQSLILLAIGIGGTLLFVFLLLPLIIKTTAQIKMSSAPQIIQQVVPQAPILNAPESYLSTTDLAITGYGEPEMVVQLVVNNQQKERHNIRVSADGTFSIPVLLNEGENTITAFTIYDKETQSDVGRLYTVTVDQEAPPISLTNLSNGQEIVGKEQRNFQLNGETESNIKIYVNDRLTRSDENGNFSIIITLEEGENHLFIEATDKADNQTQLEINFKFIP